MGNKHGWRSACVGEWLDSGKEERDRLTPEALVDVDACGVIDHQTVWHGLTASGLTTRRHLVEAGYAFKIGGDQFPVLFIGTGVSFSLQAAPRFSPPCLGFGFDFFGRH